MSPNKQRKYCPIETSVALCVLGLQSNCGNLNPHCPPSFVSLSLTARRSASSVEKFPPRLSISPNFLTLFLVLFPEFYKCTWLSVKAERPSPSCDHHVTMQCHTPLKADAPRRRGGGSCMVTMKQTWLHKDFVALGLKMLSRIRLPPLWQFFSFPRKKKDLKWFTAF